MANFYTDFVAGASNARQRLAERQQMQIAEDQNRRANEEAKRKADAEYQKQAAQAEMFRIWQGQGGAASGRPEPEPFVLPEERQIGMFAGAPQREAERLSEAEMYKEKLTKSAEILNSKGFYAAARDMTKQAMDMEEHTLTQRIKTLEASGKEADQIAGIAQGVYDQDSFEGALSDMLRAGYADQVQNILSATGGQYTPQTQQMLQGIIKSAETGKNAQAMDLATLKDARDARKQRFDMQAKEREIRQKDQKLALDREKLGPGGAKAGEIKDAAGGVHKMSDLRQEYTAYLKQQKNLKEALEEEGRTDLDLEDMDDLADLAEAGISVEEYKAAVAPPVSMDEWVSGKLGIPVSKLSPGKGGGGKLVIPKDWTPPKSAPGLKREWLTPANIAAVARAKGVSEDEVRKRFGLK